MTQTRDGTTNYNLSGSLAHDNTDIFHGISFGSFLDPSGTDSISFYPQQTGNIEPQLHSIPQQISNHNESPQYNTLSQIRSGEYEQQNFEHGQSPPVPNVTPSLSTTYKHRLFRPLATGSRRLGILTIGKTQIDTLFSMLVFLSTRMYSS